MKEDFKKNDFKKEDLMNYTLQELKNIHKEVTKNNVEYQKKCLINEIFKAIKK